MDALSISGSGIQAAQVQLAASTHNIANLNTDPDEIKLYDVRQFSRAGGGVIAQAVPSEAKTVNLENELLNVMTARAAYKANAFALKVSEEVDDALFDMMDDIQGTPHDRRKAS